MRKFREITEPAVKNTKSTRGKISIASRIEALVIAALRESKNIKPNLYYFLDQQIFRLIFTSFQTRNTCFQEKIQGKQYQQILPSCPDYPK